MEHQTTSTMIEVLTPIWQRVLQLPSIRIDDDFFALGGTPAQAGQLFKEIAQRCSRELPVEMIYQAPTVATLAAIVEQPTSRLPALLLLRPGNEELPIFLTHGLGGSVLEFFELMKHLQSSHPVYGMQAKGTDGLESPLESIEDMAEFFLNAIRQRQPHGPYLLVGHSLGGLVVLEIAQRLTQSRETVALLALLDAYPHRRYLSRMQRIRLTVRRVGRRASFATRLPIGRVLSHLLFSSKQARRIPLNAGDTHLSQPSSSLSTVHARVKDGANLALMNYRPRFYPSAVKFIRAEKLTEFPDDPAAIWQDLTSELEVETVAGDHHEMLMAEGLASTLSRYFREALQR